MTEAEKAYQYFVIAVPESEEQAKAYFWARKALRITLTPPNEWVSVEDELPARDGVYLVFTTRGSVTTAHFYAEKTFSDGHRKSANWQGNRNVTHWTPLPAPPGKDNNVPAKTPNEPLTIKQLREMDGEPVYDYLGQEWYVIQEYYGHELTMTDGTRFFDDDEIDGVDKRFYRRPPEGEEKTR